MLHSNWFNLMFHAKILIIPENDTIFSKKTDKLVLIFSVISFLLLYRIRISLHLNISFILFIKKSPDFGGWLPPARAKCGKLLAALWVTQKTPCSIHQNRKIRPGTDWKVSFIFSVFSIVCPLGKHTILNIHTIHY